jgi:dTDP-3,4-didehydro-2,6-dideoxy-alpha-D-glucose 3-reductase
MDVLLIGYSSLVQRRVLASLVGIEGVHQIHVASRRALASHPVTGPQRGRWIVGYDRALSEVSPGLAYVSLPNALHYPWCMKALSAGFHVIVDKPAFLDLREASEVAALARQKGLCCAEAVVWQYHPMLDLLRELKQAEPQRPLAAHACFTSPALDPANFRLDAAMGGGVIYDRASYAITCGRAVFDQEPEAVACDVVERDAQTGIDLTCRITLQYPERRFLDGFYSLKADYRNTLSVMSETYSLDFDRLFTPPVDYEGPAVIRRTGQATRIATPAANTFRLFLRDVVTSIDQGRCDPFVDRLVLDASILDRIRNSRKGH